MFTIKKSPLLSNPFDELHTTKLEQITNGRFAAILVESVDNKVPIVRTTAIYKNPAMRFTQLHRDIISTTDYKFNNAMIELYTNEYKTMGFHSDQSLDLAEDSYIGIYSCYKYPDNSDRKLIIKNKSTKEISEIVMLHNHIILFSTETNNKFMHKIVLCESKKFKNNEWIGITYRLSKTFINPYNPHLRIANNSEKQEFYKLKNIENTTVQYVDNIHYTISPSDLLPVE
jgi:hypothetical protein